jgi:predicted RNA-binding Zn ribbon-like protein
MTTTFEERPAPGRLELVRTFVNTLDIDEGTDALTTPAELREWLTGRDLLDGGRVTGADLTWALEVREAFRDLLVANAAGAAPSALAVAVLNQAGERCGLAPRLAPDGGAAMAVPATGIPHAIGSLLDVMYAEMADGRWVRLKACVEDECHWAFYDASRNRSSHWCHMGECGNRSKNRAYYARRRERP